MEYGLCQAGLDNHWLEQDLFLVTGLVGVLGECTSWVVLLTGERKSQNGGSDLGLTWLQSPQAWMWTGFGVY